MAVRERPAGFRGGIARWVAPDDVRQIVDELGECATAGDLVEWADSSPLAPRSPDDGRQVGFVGVRYGTGAGRAALVSGPGTPLSDEQHAEAVATAVTYLAAHRREAAVWAHARERGLSVYVAFNSGRSLLRCPACDAPRSPRWAFGGLYCLSDECQEAQAAEVAELVRRDTSDS